MHGPKRPFLLAHGPGVVVVNCWDRLCILGRALRTKETMPDFLEWCRVTRHPRVFRGLTGCQRDPREWGVIEITVLPFFKKLNFSFVLQYKL